MTSVMKPQLNLLFSLPDELIRTVYEMDMTYSSVFSSEAFVRELLETTAKKDYVRTLLESYVYRDLQLAQEDDCSYISPFLIMNTTQKDGVIYYTQRTKNEVFQRFGTKLGDRVIDKYTETFVFLSLHQGVLRWMLLPTVLKDVAHKVVKDVNAIVVFNSTSSDSYDCSCFERSFRGVEITLDMIIISNYYNGFDTGSGFVVYA